MEANIYIEGTIGYVDPNFKAYTVTDLVSDIKQAREQGATAFNFFIDSQGGLVEEGFAMASIIESMPEPTTTIATNVYSIANVIFFAGKTRRRDTLSTFMLHQALTTLTGNSDDLRQVAEILDRESDRIASYISTRSGLGMGEVKALMKIDRYIDEEEAERLGFFGESPAPLKAVAFVNQETFTDYPQAAVDNAKKALKWLEENENPNDCLTRVGFARANQLANKEPLSRDTVARMAAFERHRSNKDVSYDEGCGGIAWDAWGGDEGIAWAQRTLDSLESETTNTNLMSKVQEAFANLGRALGVYNSAEAMEHSKEEEKAMKPENNEMEEIDKDALISELQTKIQELEGRLQAMSEEAKAMESEEMNMEKKYENLQNLVVNLESKQEEMQKQLEEAKRLSSSATAPVKHERFNQKPEPFKTDAKDSSDGLTGAAKFQKDFEQRLKRK